MRWTRRRLRFAIAAATAGALAGCGPGSPAAVGPPQRLAVVPAGRAQPSPVPPAAAPSRPPVVPVPAFSSSVSAITPAVRARMYSSWRPGCPVPLADLRYVQVSYWGFDGAAHRGELVVHARAVGAVVPALRSEQNPYVGIGGFVAPPGSRSHVDRSRSAPGMIHAGDAVVRAFAAVGWSWGGDWVAVKDYQHFSATGR